MTVKQLIAELRKFPQDATIALEIQEPYDDDAALLQEPLTTVLIADGKVILA